MSRKRYSRYYEENLNTKVEEAPTPEESKAVEETLENIPLNEEEVPSPEESVEVEVKFELAPEAPSPEEVVSKVAKIVNCEKVNVREKADVNSAALTILPAGEEVVIKVKESTDAFYAVIAKGINGFIMKQFVDVVK